MRLRYKCRRCEKIFYEGEDIDRGAMVKALIKLTVFENSPRADDSLFTTHFCDGGTFETAKTIGIADLQGAS
jgi:hypothetical protein